MSSNVPEAKAFLEQLKMEVANEQGINLKPGLQRRPYCKAERHSWWLHGQEDDRTGSGPQITKHLQERRK